MANEENKNWEINSCQNGGNFPADQVSPLAYAGSMQSILQENVGYYVVCEFLIGTQTIERKEGILYQVGVSYLVIYEVIEDRYVICDFYSLKFVTFYPPNSTPGIASLSPEELLYVRSLSERGPMQNQQQEPTNQNS